MAHQSFFKADKVERQEKNLNDRWFYKQRKAHVYGLDSYTCRCPFHWRFVEEWKGAAYFARIIQVHHILGRRVKDAHGLWNLISFCCICHSRVDKDRPLMLVILRLLKESESDFRWDVSKKDLEKRYQDLADMLEKNIK